MNVARFPGGMSIKICTLLLFLRWTSDAFGYAVNKNPYIYDHDWATGEGYESYDKEMREADPALQSFDTSVLFFLYTKSSVNQPQQLWLNDVPSLIKSNFNMTRNTKVVIHGYMDNYQSEITQQIKNALLKFGDDNVIAVDWSHYTHNLIYSWVAIQVSDVGNYVGQFVNFLVDQGLPSSAVHLMGHSLGAHVAGFAGKELSSNGHKVARVTGLDPALPGFNGYDAGSRLSSTDGEFVDCIHTCGRLLGYDIAICQADFYPNGGENIQPGCPWWDLGTCSHGRSYNYFAESIDKTHHFNALTCNAIIKGVPYGCNNEGAIMGYYASDKYLGEFYLNTRSSSPFALNISATFENAQ